MIAKGLIKKVLELSLIEKVFIFRYIQSSFRHHNITSIKPQANIKSDLWSLFMQEHENYPGTFKKKQWIYDVFALQK